MTDVVEGRRDARVVAVTERRHDPGPRPLPRVPRGRGRDARPAGRRARRGDGLRAAGRDARRRRRPRAPAPGGSQDISPNRVTVTPAPGVPGKLPFWNGDAVGRPVELGRAIGAFTGAIEADLAQGREGPREGGERGCGPSTTSTSSPPRTCSPYLEDEREATGALPDRPPDRHRALPRRAGRLAARHPHAVRRPGPRAVDAGAREPGSQERLGLEVQTIYSDDGIAIRLPEGDATPRRRRGAPVPGPRGGRGPRRRAGRPVEPVRQPVPRERRAGAAPAAPPPGHADAAVAAAPARRRPARASRRRYGQLPDPRRDVPRVPRRRVRPAGAARGAGRRRAARDRRPQRRDREGVGVRGQPAVRLRRGLHVRGRRPAGRAAGPGAHPRPRPAPRAAGPGGAARAARSRRARRPRAEPPGARRRAPRDEPRPGPRPAAAARRPEPRRGRGADRRRARRGVAPPRRARVVAARGPGADRRRGALDRDGGRRPLPRRRRRVGAAGRAAGVPRPGRRGARRAARPLGADARPVPGRRARATLGAADRRHRRRAAPPRRERARCSAGEFRPGGAERELCDPEVLRLLRRRSLAKLRREVEPVDPVTLARFLPAWQGVAAVAVRGRAGDAAPRVGGPGAARRGRSTSSPACRSRPRSWSATCCPRASRATSRGSSTSWARWARSPGPAAAASVATTGGSSSTGPAASCSGRAACPTASSGPSPSSTSGSARISAGAAPRSTASCSPRRGAGPTARSLDALWDLVWAGEVTNDTFAPLRALRWKRPAKDSRPRPSRLTSLGPPEAAGRWSLVDDAIDWAGGADDGATGRRRGRRRARRAPAATRTERVHAQALALLERHGVLTREAVGGEAVEGGFSAVYPVLRALEESGRIRRGYFVDGLGAAQFALPGAVDRLRAMRDQPAELAGAHGRVVHLLAAADPANPYGAALAWPRRAEADRRPLQRAAGAYVVLVDGAAVAVPRARRLDAPGAAGGRRPRDAGHRARRAGRPRRRRSRPRARHRQDRRRAGRDVRVPRRPARGGVRRRATAATPSARRRRPRRIGGTRGRRRSAPRARPMPEGDTLFRTAAGLRPYLVGRTVDAARARQPGPQADRLVGATVTGVEAQGKNLLIRFDNGLEVRTHLRHARLVAPLPARRTLASAAGASAARDRGAGRRRRVLRRPDGRAVRAAGRGAAPEPAQARAGPARRRRSTSTRRCAGSATPRSARRRSARRCSTSGRSRGSATRSGTRPCGRRACRRSCRSRRWTTRRCATLVERSRSILKEGARTGRRPSDIHGRSGRPCPRCGSLIRSEAYGGELPRIAYWCPTCQPDPRRTSRPAHDPRTREAARERFGVPPAPLDVEPGRSMAGNRWSCRGPAGPRHPGEGGRS